MKNQTPQEIWKSEYNKKTEPIRKLRDEMKKSLIDKNDRYRDDEKSKVLSDLYLNSRWDPLVRINHHWSIELYGVTIDLNLNNFKEKIIETIAKKYENNGIGNLGGNELIFYHGFIHSKEDFKPLVQTLEDYASIVSNQEIKSLEEESRKKLKKNKEIIEKETISKLEELLNK